MYHYNNEEQKVVEYIYIFMLLIRQQNCNWQSYGSQIIANFSKQLQNFSDKKST